MRNEKPSIGSLRLRRAVPALAVLALAGALAIGAAAAPTRQAAAPTNSSAPTVQGTFQVKETISVTTGTWKNTPTSYTYQWQRCNSSGSGCASISGATTKSYTLTSDDVGHTVVAVVTAINADGKASAGSKPSPIVSDSSAPRNTARPTISGTAKVGETLQVSQGTWSGGVRDYAYQWERCDKQGNNCVAVANATAPAYGVRTADVGSTLRAEVTATSGAGKTTVNTDRSDPVAALASAAAAPAPTCTAEASVAAGDLAAPMRLLIAKFQFTPSVVTRSTTTVTAHLHVADTCGRSVSGAKVWSTAIPYNQVSVEQGTTASDGWVTLQFSVDPVGFPANPGKQQILAMLVRATKPNGSVLAGVSARRVLRENVDLHR